MRQITRYQAFDGQEFDTVDACRAHEAKHVESRLVGLTIEQIRAALSRQDIELADAFEEIGKRCATARREAGEFKRKPKQGEGDGKSLAEPAAEPVSWDAIADDVSAGPEARGRAAFKAGRGGIVPSDLAGDKAGSEGWLISWDYEALAAGQAPRRAA